MARIVNIQVRRDTAANWTATNPTLSAGEIGFESDTNKAKIGTGALAWTALSYLVDTALLATLASPTFTGTPAAPTATAGTATTQIATTAFVDTSFLKLSGGTLTGALTLSADPASALQPATKQYADAIANGLDWKASVRFVTTANDTLSGLAARNGVTPVAGDRVGVISQTTASANGIYVAAAGAWTRATDADISAEVTNGLTFMSGEGTIGAGATYKLDTADPITLGTTALSFNLINAGTAIAASGVTFSATGNVSSTSVQSAIAELDTEKLALTGGTMSGAIAMGASKITGLAAGTANGDALRYEQLTYAALVDGAGTLTGQGNKILQVNSAGTAVQYTTIIDGGSA